MPPGQSDGGSPPRSATAQPLYKQRYHEAWVTLSPGRDTSPSRGRHAGGSAQPAPSLAPLAADPPVTYRPTGQQFPVHLAAAANAAGTYGSSGPLAAVTSQPAAPTMNRQPTPVLLPQSSTAVVGGASALTFQPAAAGGAPALLPPGHALPPPQQPSAQSAHAALLSTAAPTPTINYPPHLAHLAGGVPPGGDAGASLSHSHSHSRLSSQQPPPPLPGRLASVDPTSSLGLPSPPAVGLGAHRPASAAPSLLPPPSFLFGEDDLVRDFFIKCGAGTADGGNAEGYACRVILEGLWRDDTVRERLRHWILENQRASVRDASEMTRERSAADRENELQRTQVQISHSEERLRMQQELETERDQNVQSAHVIAQQITLIDSLKAKIDLLVDHANSSIRANEARDTAEAQIADLRRLNEALQFEVNEKQTTMDTQRIEIADAEQRLQVASAELRAAREEVEAERMAAMKSKRRIDVLQREHASELEELLRQHTIEQQQQLTEKHKHGYERDELLRRVQEIQAQREAEARQVQQELERQLASVETVKSELRLKQQELIEDWKMWHKQVADERTQMTQTLADERREMDNKIHLATQELEAERKLVEVDKASISSEWRLLKEAQGEKRSRERHEIEVEREHLLASLKTRHADIDSRELRVVDRERQLEVRAVELDSLLRDKSILDTEVRQLRVDRERLQRELREQEERFSLQLREVRDGHHSKLEEQCRKHSEAVEMINKLRAQISGRGSQEGTKSPQSVSFLEKKLEETERKLLESEHVMGQIEGRCANMNSELAAAESRIARSDAHVDELNRQIMEYKQELTEVRVEREALRQEVKLQRGSVNEELDGLLAEKEHLTKQLRLATLANREEKFVHLCSIHKGDGFEGLIRSDLENEDDAAHSKEASKAAYTSVLTSLERMKQQPFVCAGCVTHMYHSFDKLLRALHALDSTSDQIPSTEDVMVFLMALTSRLSPQGEQKIHDAADALLKNILTLDP